MIPPTSAPSVGIIGGGQLAQMTQQAAISLGFAITVLDPDPACPAVRAGARHVAGRPDRLDDLVRLAEEVDVVTLDHEQTPPALLAELAGMGHHVAPGAEAARLGRDKAAARQALAPLGVPMAPWALVGSRADADAFAERHGPEVVVKAPTGGYDGRGVWRAASPAEVARLVEQAGRPLLVEPVLPFSHELSVIVARSAGGADVAAYPPMETRQVDGRCHEVFAPASVPPAMAADARHLAAVVARAIDLEGTMAIELFVLDDRLLLNELALRPHNSGHLTIEACATSQFENHLRAIAGLPLGATDLRVGAAAMVNVVGDGDGGDPFDRLAAALHVPGASVHRYGKSARPGRKIGHITATATEVRAARAIAARAGRALAPGRAA